MRMMLILLFCLSDHAHRHECLDHVAAGISACSCTRIEMSAHNTNCEVHLYRLFVGITIDAQSLIMIHSLLEFANILAL